MTTDKLQPLFKEYQADFDYCEAIIKEKSKSFYAAFSQLPQQKAMSVYAIYAFCREADDSIDVHKDVHRLNSLRDELKNFEAGIIPDRPVWRALFVVFKYYPMTIKPFYDMLEGQEMDVHFQQPNNQAELENYCYYVAGTVGLMLLPLLSKQPEAIQDQAKALGTAMQLTNILRDVGEDFDAGRIYFPKDRLTNFGYDETDLAAQKVNESFAQLWESEAQLAEANYDYALTMLHMIDDDAREPLLLAIYFYREILNVVRENDYQCLTKRHYVGKRRKLALYYQTKKKLNEVNSKK